MHPLFIKEKEKNSMPQTSLHHDNLQEYYGKVLQHQDDLKTGACCTEEAIPDEMKRLINNIDDEIIARFYGCGSPIPAELEGRVVLDLGCGTGRDAYILSQLVGKEGFVIGVDITDEQLAVARKHCDGQMRRFGYDKPNVEFKKGFIEDLQSLGIKDNSVDVVISNCVINLSPDKKSVFSEIFRVLKPGGELYFSDVFAGRRIPEELIDDQVLHGECLSGAMYIEDFRRMLRETGCADYRTVSSRRIGIDDPRVYEKIGMIDFYSITVRAFKLEGMEDICEDYGQTATYLGTIPGYPHFYELDDHHKFITGKPMLVCGNTAGMVGDSRLGKHFRVTGNRSVHYGPFECAPAPAAATEEGDSSPAVSCC